MPLVDDLQQTIATLKQLQLTMDAVVASIERIAERIEALERPVPPRAPRGRRAG